MILNDIAGLTATQNAVVDPNWVHSIIFLGQQSLEALSSLARAAVKQTRDHAERPSLRKLAPPGEWLKVGENHVPMGRGKFRMATLRPSLLILRPALILAGFLSAILDCYSDSLPSTPVQGAVDRGLHYLQQEAFRWKETRQCAACHHAATMIWTFNEARARGYSVDEQALQEIMDWAFDMKRNGLTEQAPPRNVLNLGWVYLLLSVETAGSLERSTNGAMVPMIDYECGKAQRDSARDLVSDAN
jgi:hypothetical protein